MAGTDRQLTVAWITNTARIMTSEGEEVVFKITLPRAIGCILNYRLETALVGPHIFESCENSNAEPTYLKCADEYTSTEENNGYYEDLDFAHYTEGSRTFYLGVDAWCYETWNSSTCPLNASKDFTLVYYVVDYSN